MAFLDETYSVADMPESSFEPVPAGWYTATVEDATLNRTKNGSGQYIALKWKIDGPTNTGRTMFSNLNIRNANETAERIGREKLGQLMRAGGLAKVTDTDQLIGVSCEIKVSVKPETDDFPAGNEIKGFKASSGSTRPVASTSAKPSHPATASKPAWMKPKPAPAPAADDDDVPF